MDEKKSLVMSRAAELRNEGCDPSYALSTAWSEYDDDYDEDYKDYEPKPQRRSNPVSKEVATEGSLGLLLLAGVAGWLFWFKSKNGRWPWQQAQISQARLLQLRAKYQAQNRPKSGLTETPNGFLWSAGLPEKPKGYHEEEVKGSGIINLLPETGDTLPGGINVIYR